MKKIKKVMFVAPYPEKASVIMEASHYPPLGLAYTSSYLEKHGFECRIIDALLFKLNTKKVLEIIEKYDPDTVGLSFNVVTIHEVVEISKMIKAKLNIPVFLGGPSSAGDPKFILKNSKADCVVRKEGELVTLNLVQSNFDLKNVLGISYLENGELKQNLDEKLIEDIDSIPFPAWHLLPKLSLYKNRSRRFPIAPMLTSRGCPAGCVFCGSANTRWRYRSPDNVVQEMELLSKKYGVKQIDILDDNFTLISKRANEILDKIIEKKLDILITFPNGMRADKLDEQLIRKMKKAGVYRTGIGIETGDEGVMEKIDKGLDLKRVRESIRLLRKYGIIVFGYFQFGLPGDTKKTMRKTIEFAKEVNPHWANFGITTPLPGTKLYDDLVKAGKIEKEGDGSIESGYYAIKEAHFDSEDITKEDIEYYQKQAWKEFYFRPIKILDTISTIRSWREFEWTIRLALPIFKGLFNKKNPA